MIVDDAVEFQTAIRRIEKQTGTLYLKIEKSMEDINKLQELKEILKDSKGNTDVVLFYESSRRTIRLKQEHRVSPTAGLLKKLSAFLGEKNVVLK